MAEPRGTTLTAAATPAVIDLVLDELDLLWAHDGGVDPGDRRRFETGLVEVLGNVVEHGGAGALTVEVHVTPSALLAVLGDDGAPVGPDLDAVTMPGPYAESGRGLALALACLDRLGHERVDGRNRWTLRCDRARSAVRREVASTG